MTSMDAEGIPDLETPVNQDEGLIPPRDHPQAVEEFGTTAAEERATEPLADRVLREEPDFDEGAVAQAADEAIGGRLTDAGSEDVEGIDDEKDIVAIRRGRPTRTWRCRPRRRPCTSRTRRSRRSVAVRPSRPAAARGRSPSPRPAAGTARSAPTTPPADTPTSAAVIVAGGESFTAWPTSSGPSTLFSSCW